MSVLARQIHLELQGATAPARTDCSQCETARGHAGHRRQVPSTSGRSLLCFCNYPLSGSHSATTWGVECCKGQSTASFVQWVLTWNSLFFLQHQHTMGLADSLGVAHFGECMWTFKLSLSQMARSTKCQTRYLIRSFSVDREQDNIGFFPAKL